MSGGREDLLSDAEDLSNSRGEGVEGIGLEAIPFPCETASHLGLRHADLPETRAPAIEEGLEKTESWEGERRNGAEVRRDGRVAAAEEEALAAAMEGGGWEIC